MKPHTENGEWSIHWNYKNIIFIYLYRNEQPFVQLRSHLPPPPSLPLSFSGSLIHGVVVLEITVTPSLLCRRCCRQRDSPFMEHCDWHPKQSSLEWQQQGHNLDMDGGSLRCIIWVLTRVYFHPGSRKAPAGISKSYLWAPQTHCILGLEWDNVSSSEAKCLFPYLLGLIVPQQWFPSLQIVLFPTSHQPAHEGFLLVGCQVVPMSNWLWWLVLCLFSCTHLSTPTIHAKLVAPSHLCRVICTDPAMPLSVQTQHTAHLATFTQQQ